MVAVATIGGESNFLEAVALLALDLARCECCGKPIPEADIESYRAMGCGPQDEPSQDFPATCEDCAEAEALGSPTGAEGDGAVRS